MISRTLEGQYDKSTPQPSHAIVDDKSSLFGCLFVFPFNRKVWTMTGPGDTHVVVQCSSLYAYIYMYRHRLHRHDTISPGHD